MKNIKLFSCLLFTLILTSFIYGAEYIGASSSDGYTFYETWSYFGANNIDHWAAHTEAWYLNSTGWGVEGLAIGDVESQINAAHNTWSSSQVATTNLSFSYLGRTTGQWGEDGMCTIQMVEAGDRAYDYNGPFYGGGGGVTIIKVNSNYEFIEADIIQNGRDQNWDLTKVKNNITHEIGHTIGLADLPVNQPETMSIYCSGDPSTLEPDDISGVSFLYGGKITENASMNNYTTNYFNWNIEVVNGKTLTIPAGTTVQFASGSSLTVNGILTANGGSASTPITFNFSSPNSTTQNGIKFNSGSSVSFSYCKVLNAYNGIYENGASVNVSNSAISYCTIGLYLYNSNPTIQACNIHNNTTGIYLISSSPYLYNNYIQNNTSPGVNCSASSNPKFGNGSTQGNNYISGNLYGVFAQNNSIPMLGKNSTIDGGYNNIVNNTTYNVYNMSSNSIYAEDNWWGSTNTSLFKIAGTSGVSTTGYLSASVSIPAPPLSKTSGSLYTSSSNNDIPLLSELNKANQYIAANNPDQAKAVCFNLINNYPDYSVSFNALNLLKDIYLTNNVDSIKNVDSVKNIYQTLFNNKGKNKLYAIAGLLLADVDKENKLKHLDDVINNYSKDSVVELALTDKFIYYYFDKNDKQNALAISKLLDNSYPLGLGAIQAHQILGDMSYYNVGLFKRQTQQNNITQTPTEYSLSNNYPNPFNPTTIIEYQLPKDGFVSLKVYDVLGREIKTLVNGFRTLGKYSVSFDGSNLASGIYFYQLKSNGFSSIKKMILTK